MPRIDITENNEIGYEHCYNSDKRAFQAMREVTDFLLGYPQNVIREVEFSDTRENDYIFFTVHFFGQEEITNYSIREQDLKTLLSHYSKFKDFKYWNPSPENGWERVNHSVLERRDGYTTSHDWEIRGIIRTIQAKRMAGENHVEIATDGIAMLVTYFYGDSGEDAPPLTQVKLQIPFWIWHEIMKHVIGEESRFLFLFSDGC